MVSSDYIYFSELFKLEKDFKKIVKGKPQFLFFTYKDDYEKFIREFCNFWKIETASKLLEWRGYNVALIESYDSGIQNNNFYMLTKNEFNRYIGINNLGKYQDFHESQFKIINT